MVSSGNTSLFGHGCPFGLRSGSAFQLPESEQRTGVWLELGRAGSQCLLANRLPLCSYADPLCGSLRGRWIVPWACGLQFERNNV